MNRFTDYDPFAWVYNEHWGHMFTDRVVPVLDELVLHALAPDARLLDVCCGTGQLAQILTARDYRVTGVDGSEDMLRYARQNAPDAEFMLADARTFSLPPVFDGVVSVFDSLNHVLSLTELTFVFTNVHAALKEGGVLVFDLNMEEGFRWRWRNSFSLVEDDHVCVMQLLYRPQENVHTSNVTLFRLEDGRWQRSDFSLTQKCYSEQQVQSALQTAGFADIEAYDAQGDLGMGGEIGRSFFVARKSAG